jgi:TatD DNase family protein
MVLTDTHCHLQFDKYKNIEEVVERAKSAGVKRLICVGTSFADSQKAIAIAEKFDNCWASLGWHPYESKNYYQVPEADLKKMEELLTHPKVIAVGECGLDYHYEDAEPNKQKIALRFQIENLALKHDLPVIFHIRDAWKNFWPIFDEYKSAGQQIHGVVHSFTGGPKQLEQALSRGLLVALNGIVTYTRDSALLEAAKQVPLDMLILETDAPFLTPEPYRNEICEPKHVRTTAEFLATLRNEPLEKLAAATTANSARLFGLGTTND